jgi:hypothetical protein
MAMRRRVLRGAPRGEPLAAFLQQVRAAREEPEERGPPGLEVLMASLVVIFVLAFAIAAMLGNVTAGLVGSIGMVFLVMSFMLITGNYLIATGRFTSRTIIYWYMAAAGIGLMTAYAVVKGVLPLVFVGVFPAQFEFLLNWAVWFIPIVLILGILVVGLATPARK